MHLHHRRACGELVEFSAHLMKSLLPYVLDPDTNPPNAETDRLRTAVRDFYQCDSATTKNI